MPARRKRTYQIVDLFCGCGGISRGFENTGRFTTEAGIELEPHPARAFLANIRNRFGKAPHMHIGDIADVVRPVRGIETFLAEVGFKDLSEIDMIVGGPPCQGFSRNGVRKYEDREAGKRFYDDPRNHLYKDFLRFIEVARPKAVLVENVREFLNFGGGVFSEDLVKRFDELGYDVKYCKLCAADYGVPQIRNRVFFIAVRKDVCDVTGFGPRFPKISHERADNDLFTRSRPYHTVRDAFRGLPTPVLTPKDAILPYSASIGESNLEKYYRSKKGMVYNHVVRKLSEKQIDRINAVGTGRMQDIDEDLRTRAFYGSAYRRLDWDKPALTITTWVYHVGSGQFAHPQEDRGITMREAARLQSFDDDFVFPPLVNPTSQMIGNAVPPILAEAIAEELAYMLDAYTERCGLGERACIN